MRLVGAVFALAALVVVPWGVGLIVKAATGGTPDSSTAAIVGIGAVLVVAGLALGVVAVRALAERRR